MQIILLDATSQLELFYFKDLSCYLFLDVVCIRLILVGYLVLLSICKLV